MGLILAVTLYSTTHTVDIGTDRLLNTALTTGLLFLGAFVYTVALLLTRTIGETEIRLLPMGDRICHWLTVPATDIKASSSGGEHPIQSSLYIQELSHSVHRYMFQ